MSGFGSFGFQKSTGSQSSSSESGVSPEDRALATGETFRILSGLEGLTNQVLGTQPNLQLNAQGLTPGVSNLVGSLIKDGVMQQFNKVSGGGALKGQVSPKNTSSLIGTSTERAVNNALPQFINQAQSNEVFQAQAPQSTLLAAIQQYQQLANLFSNLTQGSSSQSKGKQSSFGIQLAGGTGK